MRNQSGMTIAGVLQRHRERWHSRQRRCRRYVPPYCIPQLFPVVPAYLLFPKVIACGLGRCLQGQSLMASLIRNI